MHGSELHEKREAAHGYIRCFYYQSLPTLGQEATEPRRRLISLLSVTPVANVFTIIILLQ